MSATDPTGEGWTLAEAPGLCPDCRARPGHTHARGCDVERCSSCGMQRIGCDCAVHDPGASFWTGYWPGDETCRLLGVDHNELAVLVIRAHAGATEVWLR